MTAATPDCIPVSTARTHSFSANAAYIIEMTLMMTIGGRIVASTATISPEIPAMRRPTRMAPLTAIAPGAVCARAVMSSISSSVR